MPFIALPPELEQPTASAYVYYMQELDEGYVSTFTVNDQQIYNFNMELSLDLEIAKEVKALGYNITEITESSFKELGETFKVYTVELAEEIEDYNALLQQEKEIKRKLGFYDKNIIMELVWVLYQGNIIDRYTTCFLCN